MSEPWRIITGDALEALRSFAPASVDAIVTDPPYASTGDAASVMRTRTGALTVPYETQFFEAWLREHVAEWRRVLRRSGAVWMTIDWRGAMVLDTVATRLGLPRPEIGVWDKGGLGMGYLLRKTFECFAVLRMPEFARIKTGEPDLWRVYYPAGSAAQRNNHPAEKPVPLLVRAVELVSSPGAMILDPFMGSGSTGVAALAVGRRFLGVERDADYCATARERLATACSQASFVASDPGDGCAHA